MASKSQPTVDLDPTDLELASLDLMLSDLADVAAEWDVIGDAQRVTWSLDWDQIIGAVDRDLSPRYREGAMTMGQADLYCNVTRRLAAALPLLIRLGLRCPDMVPHLAQ
jgi:hypothetical protein